MISSITKFLAGMLLLATVQCNHANCEELRGKLHERKLQWQACQTDSDCVVVGGNSKDCTGILACDFAVNSLVKEDAERIVASLPEDSVDCIMCNPPNCIDSDTPYCDMKTGRCDLATAPGSTENVDAP